MTWFSSTFRHYVPYILLVCLQWGGGLPVRATMDLARGEYEASAQQRIQLKSGWNYISFTVIPEDPNFESILADILDDIELVKNAQGAVFAPSFNIDQLSPLNIAMGYKVKAHAPASLVVTGTPVAPERTPIILKSGWNLIPYLRSATMQTDDALSSIMPSIVRVQDGSGGRLSPQMSGRVPNTLTPGRSYEVYVNQPDTLIYPANTTSPNAPIEVNTISEAVQLVGLPVGQEVIVGGYYAPGDGGGGRFVIQDSGCETDGGTCFGFEEHYSEEQQEIFPTRPYALKLEEEHIAFGTMTIDVLDDTGSPLIDFDARHFHGHRYGNSVPLRPLINYKNGVIDGVSRYSGNEYFWRFKYKFLTSPLRLVRLGIEETLDIHWFGARTHGEDAAFDNQPVINQAINAAISMGNIRTVLLSKPEVYEYFGSIEIADGLTLKGAGGTELITATDNLGNTYEPVRIKPEHTRLRVKEGEALLHMRMLYLDEGHPAHVPLDAKEYLRMRRSTISSASGAMFVALEDLILDGNWENNQDAFQNPEDFGGIDALETELRNAPGWAGFVANNHGGKTIPIGQQVHVKNIAVIGYGSNGLLGHANNVWTGENVLLGNSLWNHLWYNAGGAWVNLTFTGFAWTHGIPSWGTVSNLVYERGEIGPYRPSTGLINIRMPDIFDESETPVAPYMRSDNSWIPVGFSVDGFYIDGRNGNIESPFNGIGPNLELKNGVYIAPEKSTNSRIYIENANGFQKALYPNNRIENVTMYETGQSRGEIVGNLFVTRSEFRNIRVIDSSSNQGEGKLAIQFEANWRRHPAWENPQVVTFDGISDPAPRMILLKTDVHPQSAGADIFIINSSFNNQSNTIIAGPTQQGELHTIEGDPDKLRVFFENVTLNIGVDNYWANLELFFNNGYFRNVTAANLGRTSEDGGTVTYSATGGETFIDIPTNLFWIPEQVTVAEDDGPTGLYNRYEIMYPDDSSQFPYKTEPTLRLHFTRTLRAGERVAFSWNASVRPFPDTN